MLHNMLRAAAGRDRIPTDGLIAHYTMDNINGSTLVDETGVYDATIDGATQVTGIIGQALSFDGSNDKVDQGIINFIHQTGIFSLSFWASIDAPDNGSVHAFSGSVLASDERGFWVAHDDRSVVGDRVLRLQIYRGVQGSATVDINAGGAGVTDSLFHHYLFMGDGSTAYIYLDGVLQSSAAISSKSTSAASRTTFLGGSNHSSPFYFGGDIDLYRLYDRPLDAAERAQLYNEGA